ncbi:MAG: orotate phosphoribosyltransferase [Bdellovibrionaceae bacterium]|nr:orotate phosphoribosyltransferase [Bdellovibrionales bacterium]MCB9085966.1 orotate phosphoribosyltransferase [Pseudobdellovibrionaceae bacterium]
MDRHQLAKQIYQIAYLTGSFKLRSGQTSSEYFDKYRFEAQPKLLKEIAKAMVPLIPPGTEVLAGLEMGGIPIATALSLETGIPAAFVRKEAKEYGTCQFAEGTDVKGKKVCVIEDVVTTGGQILISTKDLRSHGAEISDVLCAIFRGSNESSPLAEAGLKLHPLFTMDELKSAGR